MKRISILLLLLATLGTRAQQVTMTFSKEPAQFIKDLNSYMTANKMEASVTAMNAMEKLAKDNKIPATWYDKMAKTCNLMTERNMTAFTHFVPYLNAVAGAAKNGVSDAQFLAWSDFLMDVTDAQKKGDNGGFLKTVDFSRDFFEQGALDVSGGKVWRVDTRNCQFNTEGLRPHVSFGATTVTGIYRGDSVTIRQTSGDYYPLENKWEGKSGKVDWARAALDPAKVYCTFKNYSINLANFGYMVDTVSFVHSDFFKTPQPGRLTDKMVSSADSATISYPRFESYNNEITVKDIAPNVSYTGGFSLYGVKVLGASTLADKGALTFYARDGKTKLLYARSAAVTVKKGEELGAEKAEVSIYFGNDSIYHPQLSVVYKIPKREVRLLRGETGMGKAQFMDSYHKHEFQTDAIFWNLDSSALNLKILSGVGQKPGIYESVNYFQKELMRKIQGYGNYEPLSILRSMVNKYGSHDLNATDFARNIDPNLKEGEIKSLLYNLVEGGFILYNEELGVITVKDKASNYVMANAKKIDYDIIRIKSAPTTGNDRIDLKNSNIDLKGVEEVPISDSSFVFFRPKNRAISLQKDRNMEFDGLVYAGRMDLYGEKYKFNYAPFTIDLTKVDTLRINVQDSGRVDLYGRPILKMLKSKVEGIKGMLEIDAPINKSSRTRLPQFPRLHSREKSYIYYDDSTVAGGAYNRKSFFFELDPFRLDSLNNFSGDIINWKGTFSSGGILPDLRDSVKIQGDGSLGFVAETPKDGYELYKGKGRYWGKFELKYIGMVGDGRITHSTADFVTHDAHFYPDSMLGTTDSISIAKTFEGVKTPAVKGHNDRIFWKPNTDSMHIYMTKKEDPFTMYDDGFTSFKGDLLLTKTGLRGNGLLDWNEATLESKDFSFQTMNLSADTSSLNIKSTGDKVTFKTPNVNAKVDFKTRIGDFVSNQKNIPTEFSYNQYTTAINQFKWYMDEKILDFKAPPDGPGEYFTSTRADQKGLKFLGKRATYSLITSIIRVEQVPEIRIADASVVPDSGVVIIQGEAKMNQLLNATIFADTIKKYHKIEHATVDIYSKQELKAVGEYQYNTKDIKQIINLTDVSCKKETEGPRRRKEVEVWRLLAKANLEEKLNFVLYPDVKFNGDVTLRSINRYLAFKGYAKIDLKHPKVASSDFFINQDVNPDTLELKYDSVKSSAGNILSAGIHLHPDDEAPLMYATVMAPKQEKKDITIFKSTGIITQNKAGEYLYGNEKKIKEKALRGNLLTYDDKKGLIKTEGKFNLGTNFGVIKTKAVGSGDVLLDSGKYKFNLTFGIDAKMDDKIQERFEFFMAGDNADAPDLSYESEKQKKAVYELCGDKEDKKLLQEFESAPVLQKRPKGFNYNMVFSDVNFVYDPDDISLRSVGKIGVAMIGKKVINKKIDGYIEFQYKGGADLFTIYLQTGTKDWFYFEYRPGTLGILSSYDAIGKLIEATAPDKRKVKGEKDRFYLYTMGSANNKADFCDYMKDRANGIIHPRFEPRLELPMLGDSAMLNDSLSTKDFKKDDQPNLDYEQQLQLEEQQDKQQKQQEIDQLEQMKMSNESIFSAPPPGRNEPKPEEPKQEIVPVETVPVPEVPKEEPKIETPKEEPKQEVVPVEPVPVKEVPKETSKKSKKQKASKEEPKQEAIPAVEAPKQEPAPATAPVETPPVQEAPKEAPKEEPKVETPKEELKAVSPPVETPAVQEAPKEIPKEEPKVEAPKEEPKAVTPPVETTPVQEAPKEAPKVETPKEEPKAVPAPVETAPVQEAPKTENLPQDTVPK